MRVLYLSTWDFTNQASDGVCKKINSQIAVFLSRGYDVDFIYLEAGKIIYKENGIVKCIGHVGAVRKTPAYFKLYRFLKDKRYDWVYNRYGMMDTFYYRLLKRLKHSGAGILVEIPTYPYAGERPGGIMYWMMFKWDELYLRKLPRVIERIITYSRDEEIFHIPAISIMNGVDLSRVAVRNPGLKKDDRINLMIVALMQPYHGYERLLYGLKQYYESGGDRDIVCHFVGDGTEKEVYQKIAEECRLEKHVIFYGRKGGEELEQIYDQADLGVCTLGAYKKGMYWSSELKAREYLAKGIPLILGMEIDLLEYISSDYYLQFPNDETYIDINRIVLFYDKLYEKGREQITTDIRKTAEKYVSMEATMRPVMDYMDRRQETKNSRA